MLRRSLSYILRELEVIKHYKNEQYGEEVIRQKRANLIGQVYDRLNILLDTEQHPKYDIANHIFDNRRIWECSEAELLTTLTQLSDPDDWLQQLANGCANA